MSILMSIVVGGGFAGLGCVRALTKHDKVRRSP